MTSLRGDARIAALLVLATVLLFADVLFLGSGFYVRDVIRDYLPSRFVLRSIVYGGEFPLWNRFFSGGQPLAANPGFQTFYPGTWLVLLPSFLFGFNLQIVLHIALAASGMYLYLRSLGLKMESALFGAIAFGFGGIILSLTNLLPFLTAVAWWPWILMFARRVIRGQGGALGLTLSLAMLLLAGEVSGIVQTAILLIAEILCVGTGFSRSGRLKPAPTLVIACLLALGIASVQLVPALDLKRDSGRAGPLAYEDATAWSMPLIRPLELFYAQAFGRITDDGREYRGAWRYRPPRLPLIYSIYCGLLVPLLALTGIGLRVTRSTWAAILAVLSYLLAIGANGPLVPALYKIGVYRSIRYPEKFVLFGVFALIVLAAMVFDRLERRFAPFLLLIALGDVGLHVNDLAPRMPRRFFAPPPVTLALADARSVSRIFHQAAWPVWQHGIPIAQGERTYWSQRTALVPFTPALYGLHSIFEIDINLTTLRPTSDFLRWMWQALGRGAPSPPFVMMGNVEYVIVPGQPIRVIRRPTLPRYYFADRLLPIAAPPASWSDRVALVAFPPFTPASGQVLSAHESANSADLQVRASGRALLVMSVTPHRYWRATIDGAPARLETANIGFQGLVVPPGTHNVSVHYGNPLILWCGLLSLLSICVAIALRFTIHY
jgi:hypothetical protein